MKVKYVVLSCAAGLMLCGAAVSWFGYGRQAETLARLSGQKTEGVSGRNKDSDDNDSQEQSGSLGESYWAGGLGRSEAESSESRTGSEKIETESGEQKTESEGPGTKSGELATEGSESGTEAPKDYIKWVDFDVTVQAMEDAYQQDVDSYGSGQHLNWIELLSYLATKYGGDFSRYKSKDMQELVQALTDSGQTMAAYAQGREYYPYYLEAYTAVLGGLVGEYEIEVPAEGNPEETHWEKKYGLRAFSPVAKGYEYSDYDDFGVARSYGYRRQHLGHDMMGQTGTPIIAIESGVVEAIGWNQYGGWRIGIRSFDKKRYYYYAHLRQNFPFNKSLQEGSVVTAGDVIGYMGHAGYSAKENVNNIDETHLHWGLQLIFDESQKEGYNEIWVDCYALTRFLSRNRCATKKNMETKEYYRIYEMRIPGAEQNSKETETGNKLQEKDSR